MGTDTDNSKATDNELFHGAHQVHDLARVIVGVPDQDGYLVRSRARDGRCESPQAAA